MYWITIMQTESEIFVIYVGKSEKKAEQVREENEDIENGVYCYVKTYYSPYPKKVPCIPCRED